MRRATTHTPPQSAATGMYSPQSSEERPRRVFHTRRKTLLSRILRTMSLGSNTSPSPSPQSLDEYTPSSKAEALPNTDSKQIASKTGREQQHLREAVRSDGRRSHHISKEERHRETSSRGRTRSSSSTSTRNANNNTREDTAASESAVIGGSTDGSRSDVKAGQYLSRHHSHTQIRHNHHHLPHQPSHGSNQHSSSGAVPLKRRSFIFRRKAEDVRPENLRAEASRMVFSEDAVIMEGYLTKESSHKYWQSKPSFYILRSDTWTLCEYRSDTDLTLLHEFELPESSRVYADTAAVGAMAGKEPTTFEITNIPSLKKPLRLNAPTRAVLIQWILALKHAIRRTVPPRTPAAEDTKCSSPASSISSSSSSASYSSSSSSSSSALSSPTELTSPTTFDNAVPYGSSSSHHSHEKSHGISHNYPHAHSPSPRRSENNQEEHEMRDSTHSRGGCYSPPLERFVYGTRPLQHSKEYIAPIRENPRVEHGSSSSRSRSVKDPNTTTTTTRENRKRESYTKVLPQVAATSTSTAIAPSGSGSSTLQQQYENNDFHLKSDQNHKVMNSRSSRYQPHVLEKASYRKHASSLFVPQKKEQTASAPESVPTHTFKVNGQTFELHVKYKLLKSVGTGAYGAVIAAKDKYSDQSVAVKKITGIFEDLVDAKRILREVRLLGHFQHKNITRLVDLPAPPSPSRFEDMYIITELMETDLHQVIYSMQPMSDDHVKYFLYQTLCAVHHIHSAGVLHRDMKPSNILLNANCDLKICDFGLARGGFPETSELTEYVVTRWYRAPEIMLSCLHYTESIDMWSVGCIFAEMIQREPLFPGNDYIHQLKLIVNFLGTPKHEDTEFVKNSKAKRFLSKLPIAKGNRWKRLFADANPLAVDLLSKMLVFNPAKRISVLEALQHPYLATFFDKEDLKTCTTPFDASFDIPDEELSKESIMELLYEDIERYHPTARDMV